MKQEEATSSLVKPEYFVVADTEYLKKYGPEIDCTKALTIDITLMKLNRVQDLYHDQTVMLRSLR